MRTVPSNEPPVECPYCDDPFPDDEILLLHKGQRHPEELSAAERSDLRDAHERESEQVRMFRLKALAALILVYFGLIMTYAVFA
jgi:hypothetical protein